MTTKESIFNEALNLFAQNGYEETTINSIVNKVGIKGSSLYNHYACKHDILKDILKTCANLFRQESPSIAERKKLAKRFSMSEVLHIMMKRFFETWKKPQTMQLWQVVSNEQFRNPQARQIVLEEKKRRIEGTTAIFEVLQQQGKMRPCNVVQVATLYIYAIHAQHYDYVLSQLNHADTKYFVDIMYQTIDLLVDAYEYKKQMIK